MGRVHAWSTASWARAVRERLALTLTWMSQEHEDNSQVALMLYAYAVMLQLLVGRVVVVVVVATTAAVGERVRESTVQVRESTVGSTHTVRAEWITGVRESEMRVRKGTVQVRESTMRV